MTLPPFFHRLLFFLFFSLCFFPFVDPPIALLFGFSFGFLFGNPFPDHQARFAKYFLQCSVVGLGFGINLHEALQVGKDGFFLTLFSITATLTVGFIVGKFLRINSRISTLISGGTAICGGSAIATLAPIIGAKNEDISVSLACIFVLNACALLIFPSIGHWVHLSETQFGWWAAIAIHDTSSVVGAAQKYGPEALRIATTVKIERTLWIIPIAVFISSLNLTATTTSKKQKILSSIKLPYFILGFILAILLTYYLPSIQTVAGSIVGLAKKMLNVSLFLIASGINSQMIKKVGIKPLIQSILLWIFISILSLWIIIHI